MFVAMNKWHDLEIQNLTEHDFGYRLHMSVQRMNHIIRMHNDEFRLASPTIDTEIPKAVLDELYASKGLIKDNIYALKQANETGNDFKIEYPEKGESRQVYYERKIINQESFQACQIWAFLESQFEDVEPEQLMYLTKVGKVNATRFYKSTINTIKNSEKHISKLEKELGV